MECPKCDGEMDRVSETPLFIDRCRQCHGLYFDQLNRALVTQDGITTGVDSGDTGLGAEYDQMVFVDCPKCLRMMDQRLVEGPLRVRFEHCPSCQATFLDAGEFSTYLQDDYREAFLGLLPEA